MTCEVGCGGIYKLPFPFTDLSSRKARPALALEEPDQRGLARGDAGSDRAISGDL